MAETGWRRRYFEAGVGVVVVYLVLRVLHALSHLDEELVNVVFEEFSCLLIA
jgi:hypothetical protein